MSLDEIGSVDRAGAIYSDVLAGDPSNAFAQDALTKIANAAAPTLRSLPPPPPPPPPASRGVRRVKIWIAAAGASTASVIATARSVRCAPNVALSVSVLDFEGDLPWGEDFAGGGYSSADDEAAYLHADAGVVLKPGAIDWLLWAIDQGAKAAYADHED